MTMIIKVTRTDMQMSILQKQLILISLTPMMMEIWLLQSLVLLDLADLILDNLF